jgi:hypothetical protein
MPVPLSVRVSEIIPAAGLGLSVTAILCGLQLMPSGTGMLLVRVHGDDSRSALMAAAMADASFVSSPAPGFAVVYGEASKVRAALGLAVPWKGNAPCSPTS